MADIRTQKVSGEKAPDNYVEQMREKIGTDFTDKKIAGKKKNEMGKDDFIKLMTAQLKYQDPTNPLKNEQMAAQLAQFSSLEQMVNVNQNLEKMSAAQRPTENVLAASLIGKRIETDSSRFTLQKDGTQDLKFDMPANADKVGITVVDNKGEVIREFDLGSMKQGMQSIKWDGKTGKGLPAVPGEYTYRVNAKGDGGKVIQVKMGSSGLVNGVVFEGGKPILLVDDKKIPLEAVGKIIAESPAAEKVKAEKGVNSLAGDKEKLSTVDQKNDGKNSAASQEKSLPKGADFEKMISMLAPNSREVKKEVVEENTSPVPYPLWNPEVN